MSTVDDDGDDNDDNGINDSNDSDDENSLIANINGKDCPGNSFPIVCWGKARALTCIHLEKI